VLNVCGIVTGELYSKRPVPNVVHGAVIVFAVGQFVKFSAPVLAYKQSCGLFRVLFQMYNMYAAVFFDWWSGWTITNSLTEGRQRYNPVRAQSLLKPIVLLRSPLLILMERGLGMQYQ